MLPLAAKSSSAVSPRATDSKNKPWSDVILREPRSPVNINLATTEVIAANLAGIAGRAFYLWTGEITTQGLDEGHPDHAFTSQKEETGYESKGVVVYIDPFGYVPGQRASDDASIFGAIDFARLIKQRINDQGPFQGYSDWEVFVDATPGKKRWTSVRRFATRIRSPTAAMMRTKLRTLMSDSSDMWRWCTGVPNNAAPGVS